MLSLVYPDCMARNLFEIEFRGFVKDFGGEVLPEDPTPNRNSADYYFREYNIVAELKCFMEDQTEDTRKKLWEIIEQRVEGDHGLRRDSRQSGFRLTSTVPSGDGGAVTLAGTRSNGEAFALTVSTNDE